MLSLATIQISVFSQINVYSRVLNLKHFLNKNFSFEIWKNKFGGLVMELGGTFCGFGRKFEVS